MCDKKAEYTIIHGPLMEDYTEACIDHVGDLLTDSVEHTIVRIHDEPADREPARCCFIGPQLEDTIMENGVLLTRDPNGRIIEIRAGGQWVYLEEAEATA